MNNKTFIIIGLFLCLLFAIPMVSAADVSADSNLIDNSVIGSNIDSQAIATSDATSIENSIDDTVSNTIIDSNANANANDGNSIGTNANINNGTEIDIDSDDNDKDNKNQKITDINSGNNKNSNDKNNLRANALGEGEGTFAQLQEIINQAAEGSTITISNNYKFVAGDDDYKSGIIIDKELTINGDGHTIDGSNLARIFYTQGEVEITLNNLVLINGNAGDGDGGAIIWDSHSGHINNVNISNCVAQNGGAIFIGHVGHDEPCFIENITLKYSNASNGGGIYLLTPTAMHNITCINCTASQDGGAIYAYSDGQGRGTDIFTFYNNTAKNGGAAYIRGNYLTITDVDAQNNSATEYGGAIYADGNHLVLDGIKFINNHAIGHDNASGGAIFFDGSNDSVVNNVHFENNSAFKNGGAICWGPTSYFGELFNSNFTNNTAGRSGGAVYWRGDNGTVENCSFIDNRANGTNLESFDFVTEDGEQYQITGGNGGAIVWLGSVGFINNSNFTNNYAKLNGGAILFRADTEHGATSCNNTNVINCSFIDNDAGQNGGAVGWNDLAANGTVSGSKFYHNTAARSGGAIFWKGQEGTIADSDFVNNSANGTNQVQPPGYLTPGGNGGAIIITGSEMNITNSNFTNNTARARGGAVYLQRNNNTNIINSKFENNSAGTNGGALDFYQGAENGHVINSTFLNNSANKTGGSIYWNGKTGVINGSLFRDNIALNQGTELNGTEIEGYGDGGAIIWTGSDGIIENSTFINNTANRRGGAIFLQGGESETCENVTVTNCTFDANIARTNGGAIDWFKGARNGHIYNSTFINNIANRTGGAIFWNGINGTVKNSNFTNNTAKGITEGVTPFDTVTTGGDGGAIMWSGPNGVIDLCNFDNNSAKWRGGAIFLQRYNDEILCENTTVSNSNFTFNHAGSNGGAVEWTLGARYGHLINSTFINNTADRSGGAVFWYGLYGEINGSSFINNTVFGNYTPGSDSRPDVSYIEEGQYCGGAVYVRGNNTGLNNDTFLNNTVPRCGGGIYVKGENTTINKCNFTNHTSEEDGGAIYVDGNNTVIGNSTFLNNTAEDGHGGAIYWKGFNGTVEGSNFTNNTNVLGGAIYIEGNLTKVNDCNFTNNSAQKGGAILVEGNNATINLSNFVDHHTDEEGGAIYINGTGTKLENSTFTNNTSHDDGGAIAWWGDNGTVYNITCLNNSGTSEGHTSSGGTISIYGSNIVMDRLNITEGYVVGRQEGSTERVARGGAIFLTGNNVTISNSTFTNCTVNSTMDSGINELNFDGGALYIIGNESKLINNTITGSIAHDGGAIYLSGNDGYIDGLNASENTATDAGGVLYISGNNTTVANSTFNNNTAWDDGAAIDWIGNDGKLINVTASDNKGISNGHTSKGGTFTIEGNNTHIDTVNVTNSYVTSSELNKVSQGGGMLVSGNNVNISNIVFNNCSVNYTGSGEVGDIDFDGGALIIFGNNTFIENATISNCTTPHNGGGILVKGNDAYMNNITATDNTATMTGGAMMIFGNHTTLGNSTFANNTAIAGGAIYWQGNDGYANNASFMENYATDDGGALFVNGTNDTIANSNFTSNYAWDDGGAIKWEGNNGKIINLTASDNHGYSVTESSKGGTLYISGNRTSIDGLDITSSSVNYLENPSSEPIQGGAVYLSGNNCNITNVNISDSHVLFDGITPEKGDEASGGAMYIVGNNTNIVNGTFSQNTAWADGGAVFIAGQNCNLNNTNFTENVAHNDGGALQIEGNNAKIYNLTADRNYADSISGSSQGGTIIITGNKTSMDMIDISNSYVDGKEGRRAIRGGAIFLTGNDCNITDASFTNCSLKWKDENSDGGAIYILGNNTYVSNANFTNNTVPGEGGALYVSGTDFKLNGGNFTDNVADLRGGAIFLTDNKNSEINNTYFENNSAGLTGGAINFYEGAEDGLVSACEFVNNTAGASGGSIYWEGTRGVIEYSSFDGSRALGNQTNATLAPNNGRGGSIIWLGDHGTIRGCDFNDSQSAKEGATLYVVGDLIKVQQSNFTNSQTNTSGGIYIQGSEGTISNCHMENTTAKESGGALYVKGNYIYLLDSDINNATSVNNGSAIYITGNTTHIENSNVTNCSSSSGNGTIMIAGYKTVMDGVNVDNNKAVYAGAVLISGSQTKISNSNFTHNNVSKDAGGIMIIGSDNSITTSNISDNYARENGGGIYYQGDRNIVSYSNIDHNSANNGANVYMAIKAKDSKLIGSNITNAKARNFGGGVEWCENSENGLIQDCYFYNCTSTAHGGAIHWYPGKYGVIDNCTFVECHVAGTKNGGAIYAGANTNVKPVGTVLSNSTFINCTTGTRGAVNWNSQGGLIYNNTFINCGVANTSVTTSWGGAQALQIEKGNNTQIIACEFYNCSGIGGGGALRVQGDGHSGYNITIANCTFDNCNNTGLAGGVYLSDMARNITFENNTFTNNSAPNVGAFFMDPKTVIVSFVNNTFINNSATGSSGYAGAAQLTGNLEVINSTFIENSAVSKAGAINAVEDYDGNNNLAIIGSTFQYNKAKEGSAINAINLDMTDTVLLENQAAFDKWTNQRNSRANGHVSINGTFVGKDNYLNGIKANGATFDNVTYCGVNGGGLYEDTVTNTDDVTSAKSTNEVHQLIVLEIYDYNNNLVDTKTTFTDENGKFNFEFDMENPQDYSYKVIHPEDNYYTGAEYSIGKAISNITIKSQNITHPEDENITFKVTGGSGTPTGNITVFINDTEGNVIFNDTIILNSTGEAKLFFPRLNASEYYIEAKYNGDNNYLPDNDTSIFHVNMAESFIKIGIENYTYNETRNITITVPYIESGRISVIVTNENFTQLYTVYVNEGTEEVQIQLPILDAGVYDIEAIFHGNNNYYPSQNATNFTVFKAASIINITADNVSGGVRETVDIHIDPEVATQNINLTVYDAQGNIVDQYYDLGLHDSRITQILTLLPKGKYNVTVTYPGDKNHNASSNSTIFYVTNDLFPIEINATNMTYGDDQIINITVPANADPDKLYININCSDWPGNKTVTELGLTIDENGLIQIDTTNTNLFANKIDAGNYTINVYYPGDDDFLSNSSSVDFEVAKAIPEMNVTPTNITYGNLEDILVEIAQNGNVTLYVTSENDPTLNITKIEVEIIEGKVYWNVNDTYLPAGEYMVEAIFNGNRNYESVNKTEKFNVTKAIPNIVIDVDDIHVGDSEYINVTVEGVEHGTTPQGNIKIIVRTIDQIVELNATGQYNLTLDDEVQGNGISVTVIYYGDDNYNYTEKSVYYDVTKKETSINVTGATPISYGTIENLLAEVNETGVTGTITIYVNSTVDGFTNRSYVATITVDDAGKATWDIDQIILPVGSYDVTAVYSGDTKYEGSESTVKVIVVEKANDYEISVEANNTVYRNDQVIIVTVPENANGTVTITIADTGIQLTADVENGKAVFIIPTDTVDFLEVHNDYNVTATYNGDDKYEAGQTASDLFNVTKAESHINVVTEDIDYTQIENITISLPDTNATGKIVITITNKSDSTQIVTTLEVDPFTTTDGVIYPFEGLAAGNYTVKVEYSGDHNYLDSEDTADFEVRKVDPTLTENSPDIVYGNDENITVIITGAEGGLAPTGTIEVKVDGVTVKTITIGAEGLEYIVTKPAVDPRHNVTVIYSGDSNYNPVTITGEFAVTQNSTIELEEDSPNIVYGNNETITITLPNDATGTVYLVVNGSYYTPIGIDDNHQAVFNIVAPIVGEYNFTAYYSGDGNYTANNISGAFNVSKADVSLTETHTTTITYGANNTITVTITGVEGPEGVLAPTGTIKVLVDGDEIGNLTIGEDLVFTSIKPFVDPQHNITVIYSGDKNYNDKTISDGVFEVVKNTTVEISEVSPDINYGENETIAVTIVGDATGTITVKMGDETVGTFTIAQDNITGDNKVFEFTKVKPDGGYYDNLVVEYSGDSNYDARTIAGEFTVSPIEPNITEDSPDIIYTNNENIAITVPEGATGTLTVTVKNSKGETVETKELVIGTDNLVVTLEKPAVDNYTLTVEYSGCANYTAKTIDGEFKVTKASNEITVVPTNITYGQTETITVTVPEGATGSVTITIGSYTDTLDVPEGTNEVVFTIPKTAADELLKANENYVVFANYSGDSNFESAIANAPFHVDPANTTLAIVVANITYGEDEIINITVNGVENGDVPTGFVTITINGTEIELTKRVDSEGKVQFNVTGLVVGEYTVNATFDSSSINYNGSNNTAIFNVTKADIKEANMNITAINITYSDDETITVIFNENNVTGNVTITINGTEIDTKELEDGRVVFTVPDLEVNGYNVIANYSGDHNYNAISIGDNFNTDFNVDKANVTVEVTPEDIIYKETEEINVTVTGVFINDNVKDNLTGKVTIYIDGVENQTKDISEVDGNGILHFSVEGLAVGMHNVTAVYHDDRNYNDKNDTKDFEVINALPEDMQVIPQNITYHIQTETITVDLGEVLNGTVQLYINDTLVETFDVVDQSSVSYTNNSLAVGNYTAKAIFTANGDSVEASANFTVSKAPVTVDVVADDSTYGDTQTITVTVDNTVGDKYNLTGNVSITINGVDYGNKTVDANGQVVFEIDGLEANDNYVVIATYYNDPNYQDNTGQDTFKVSKADVKDANKNITAINITYGEDETITVTLNENNITGKVTITINGTEIETKELEDGKVVFTVKDLEVNGYNVVANYSGDTNYNPFTIEDNLNRDFTVGKANSTVNVTAVPTIVYGNNETITVTVPIRNHTGTITLTINGTDYQFIKHLTAEDGDTIVLTNVSGLAVGLYNVTVKYDNDRNYNDSEAYALFEVTKATPTDITVTPQNITYTEDEIITVTVGDENATGTITIRIEGTDIVKDAEIENGEAKFNVTGLVVGHYTVIANYSGDANYTRLDVSAPFHVDKAASNVTIAVANITYGETEYANISIPNYNATGRAIIKVDGKAYDILPLNNNTPINLELADLAVGTHTIDVEYFDDENYNKSIAHAEFNVTKATIPVDPENESSLIVVPTNITYLNNETIAVSVGANNATGKVTIVIKDKNGETVEIDESVVTSKNITSEGSQSVTFTVPGLVVGDYTVEVKYSDDANYEDAETSAPFHVDPADSNVTVEAVNITYLDNETITVTVPIANASGTVVVKVNGTVKDERTVSGDNPSYSINVPDLAVGEYNVTVEYSNDANYNNSNASVLFHVDKRNITDVPDAEGIIIVPTNITYPNDETITVTVDVPNATGNVTIYINGTEIETKNITSDGSQTVTFTVPNLEVGEYNVTTKYTGDANYNDAEATAPFHVDPAASSVTVVPTNITYLDNETITVTVPITNASGTAVVRINGTEVNRTKFNGEDSPTIVVTVPNLAVGEYNVTVEYIEDPNYNSSNASALFHVDKANITDVNPESGIVVVPTNITYLDDETITVTVNVTNATGKVTIKINGTDVELSKNITEEGSNSVTFTVPGLVVGDYNVTVEYTDDANYNDINASALFKVSPAASNVTVVPTNITYLDDETITVTVPISNATGNVTIKINSTSIELTKNITEEGSNTVTFTVPGLKAGEYNVTATYSNDVNYNDSQSSALFNVKQSEPVNLTVDANNVTYGENVTVTVTVPDDASGSVTITIGDYTDTKSIAQGFAVEFTVPDLEVNNYIVYANYSGDDNYEGGIVNAPFHVDKANSTVIVEGVNITYGDDETITVSVPNNNATGWVTVSVNGTEIGSKKIDSNGNATFTVKDLEAGEYEVTVVYDGDRNYNGNNNKTIFTVNKTNITDAKISVVPTDINYLDDETITVTVNVTNATGKVTIKINGTDVELSKNITEEGSNSVTFTVPGLVVGDYNVTVEYSDDANYNDINASALFKVSPAASNITVAPTNITYLENETITVTVPIANASGTAVVKVNGTEVNRTKFNGEDSPTIIINVPDLAAGEYNVTVEYTDDVNYNSSNASALFHVDKANVPDANMTVVPTDITYLDNETITVTVNVTNATGKVTISINGTDVEMTEPVDGDGKVSFNVPGLVAGEYNVTAKYHDDVNYNDAEASAIFTVSPKESSVSVVPTNITYNDDETITVTVPIENATGKVTITINGTDVNLTEEVDDDGKVTFTVPGLAAGEYNVTAKYHDDPNYKDSQSSALFNVGKDNITDISVIPTDITYGDNETITISIGDNNVTGNITIKVNGTEYGPQELKDGTIVFNVPGLVAGDYEVNVTYSGDDNYNATSAGAEFTVDKATPNAYAVGTNITYGDDEQITAIVDGKNITGNATIYIDGEEIATIDLTPTETGGRAVFNVPGVTAGNHTVKVVYNGDDNHYSNEALDNFTVGKSEPGMEINATDIDYHETENITVTLPEDATGTVNVTVVGDNGVTKIINDVPVGKGGNVTIPVEDLPAGNYNVTVNYSGDDNYNATNGTAKFSVNKIDSSVDVETGNITYGDNETIKYSVPDDATGTVNVTVSGDNGVTKIFYDVPVENGTVGINVEDLPAGNYNVTVQYSGDGNYNPSTGKDSFTVDKSSSSMDINVSDIDYHDTENITVNVTGVEGGVTPTGTVNVTVVGDNGETQTFTDVPLNNDGTVSIPVEDLPAGNYNVTVKYSGDDNYNATEDNGSFSVDKISPDVKANVSDIEYGDNETVTVTLPEDATGTVNITVVGDNGVSKTFTNVPVDGSPISEILKDLPAGNYNVTVDYSGDGNYDPETIETSFTIDKATPNAYAVGTNITYGDEDQITVIVDGKNITGNATVYIDGEEYDTVDLTPTETGGRAVLNVPDLAAGNHTVKVVYNGDDNHYESEGQDNFTVRQAKPAVNVDVDDIDYHETENIKVNVTGVEGGVTPTGTVNVTVVGDNGETQTFTDVPLNNDGTVSIPVEDLPAGNYNVTVNYSGDENYTAANGTGKFTVDKIDPTADVDTDNITYGETETVTVTLPEDATGNVTITVKDKDGKVVKNETVPIGKDGKAAVDVSDLDAGDYEVSVEYPGDDNYNPISEKADFTVDKADSTVDVKTDNIDYHDTENIAVNVTGVDGGTTPTGTVNVTVTGDNGVTKTYTDVPIGEDGTVTVPVDELPAGNYNVSVDYSGDRNYNPSSSKDSFSVGQIDTPMELDAEDISYGDDETINVTVPDGATGNVTITIKDNDGNIVKKATVPISNGTAALTVPELNAGNYTVEAEYSGDNNYVPNSTDGKFEVAKANATVEIHVYDIVYGDIEELTVTCNAPGTVTIYVNGEEITLPLENGYAHILFANGLAYSGNAQWDLENLAVGTYPAKVHYNGNENYNEADDDDVFHVIKKDTSVNVTADDIKAGEDAEINMEFAPEDAPGELSITVTDSDGNVVHAENVTPKDGKASIAVSGLKEGKYNVAVSYPGSQNYTDCSNSTTFNVGRVSPNVSLDPTDIKVGDDETITVTLPDDATGNVTITVGGKEYTAPVKDGKAVFSVHGLKAGDYTVKAKYSGDEKYLPEDATGNFTVSKNKPDISADSADIKVGDDESITVSVPEDATGNVTITVGGKDYTAPVKDGKAVFSVPGLKAGNYTVKAIYSGDDKYLPGNATDKFTVTKNSPEVSVESDDIEYGDNEKITVSLPKDATGKVTIEINGKKYNADVKDGKAVFNIPGLNAGDYTVKVHYSGDAKYLPSDSTTEFSVSKADPSIKTSAPAIKVGQDGKITVIVPEDATGKITIEVNGKNYTAAIKDGKAVFTVPDLKVGKYPITVYYSGDRNYESSIVDGGEIEVLPDNGTDDNGVQKAHGQKGIDLESKATGNPILVLLLVFVFLGFIPLRRKKDDEDDEDDKEDLQF